MLIAVSWKWSMLSRLVSIVDFSIVFSFLHIAREEHRQVIAALRDSALVLVALKVRPTVDDCLRVGIVARRACMSRVNSMGSTNVHELL